MQNTIWKQVNICLVWTLRTVVLLMACMRFILCLSVIHFVDLFFVWFCQPLFLVHNRSHTHTHTHMRTHTHAHAYTHYKCYTFYSADHGTTHLSVVDKWGNAVGITSTVNTYFGSKVISPSTGTVWYAIRRLYPTFPKPYLQNLIPAIKPYILP